MGYTMKTWAVNLLAATATKPWQMELIAQQADGQRIAGSPFTLEGDTVKGFVQYFEGTNEEKCKFFRTGPYMDPTQDPKVWILQVKPTRSSETQTYKVTRLRLWTAVTANSDGYKASIRVTCTPIYCPPA